MEELRADAAHAAKERDMARDDAARARREAEDERERARSFQARMEEFGRTAESADAAARDAGAEAEGAVQAAFAARDSALAEAANARARAVMLDEQLRDLRQQVERGDPFVLVDGDDDDFVSLGRDDGVRLDLEALRAAPSFATA